MSGKISRRDFLKTLASLGAAVAVGYGGVYYVTEFEPSWIEVTQVELTLPALPQVFSGYRILQVSDIHIGGWMNRERLAHVVAQITAQAPDLVVATGDFVLGHSWSAELDAAAFDFIELLKPLTEQVNTFAVLGNHDHWTNADLTRGMLGLAGVQELRNDVYPLEREGQFIYLAGVDDVMVQAHDLERVLARLPAEAFTLLLAHEPDYADISVQTGRFSLQLSGHSHGGQVALPFGGGALVLPEWGRKYPTGLYRVGEMWLYTNRGVGMTAPFVRLNCRPEITVFTLRSAV